MSTITSNMPESSPTNPIRTSIRDCMVYGPKGKPETHEETECENDPVEEPNTYYVTITQPDRYVKTLLDMDFAYAGVNATYIPAYIKETLTRLHVGFPELINANTSAPENRLRTTVSCWQLFEIYLHTLAMRLMHSERFNRSINCGGAHRRDSADRIVDSFWLLFDLLKGWLAEPEDAGIDNIRLSQIEYEIHDRYEDLWERIQCMFIFD